MKDTFYFSHDYNARTDDKIKKLIRKHGYTGYGIYWAIIEDLYNNANALPTDYEGIAFDLRVDEIIIKSIVKGFELFVIDGEEFGSYSVEKRLQERNDKSKKARESAFKRWNKPKDNANAMQPQSDSNAIKERKGKERKVEIDGSRLILIINDILGKNYRVVPDKAKKQLRDRLKEGYSKEDFVKALTNASKDQYHIDSNYKYLTIEFITRPDKFERFVNMSDFKVVQKIL